MQEFLKELVVIGSAVGVVICKDVIKYLHTLIKTPKEVRSKKKQDKHIKKLAKLGLHLKTIEKYNEEKEQENVNN